MLITVLLRICFGVKSYGIFYCGMDSLLIDATLPTWALLQGVSCQVLHTRLVRVAVLFRAHRIPLSRL